MKKLIAVFMVFCIVFTSMPMQAFANTFDVTKDNDVSTNERLNYLLNKINEGVYTQEELDEFLLGCGFLNEEGTLDDTIVVIDDVEYKVTEILDWLLSDNIDIEDKSGNKKTVFIKTDDYYTKITLENLRLMLEIEFGITELRQTVEQQGVELEEIQEALISGELELSKEDNIYSPEYPVISYYIEDIRFEDNTESMHQIFSEDVIEHKRNYIMEQKNVFVDVVFESNISLDEDRTFDISIRETDFTTQAAIRAGEIKTTTTVDLGNIIDIFPLFLDGEDRKVWVDSEQKSSYLLWCDNLNEGSFRDYQDNVFIDIDITKDDEYIENTLDIDAIKSLYESIDGFSLVGNDDGIPAVTSEKFGPVNLIDEKLVLLQMLGYVDGITMLEGDVSADDGLYEIGIGPKKNYATFNIEDNEIKGIVSVNAGQLADRSLFYENLSNFVMSDTVPITVSGLDSFSSDKPTQLDFIISTTVPAITVSGIFDIDTDGSNNPKYDGLIVDKYTDDSSYFYVEGMPNYFGSDYIDSNLRYVSVDFEKPIVLGEDGKKAMLKNDSGIVFEAVGEIGSIYKTVIFKTNAKNIVKYGSGDGYDGYEFNELDFENIYDIYDNEITSPNDFKIKFDYDEKILVSKPESEIVVGEDSTNVKIKWCVEKGFEHIDGTVFKARVITSVDDGELITQDINLDTPTSDTTDGYNYLNVEFDLDNNTSDENRYFYAYLYQLKDYTLDNLEKLDDEKNIYDKKALIIQPTLSPLNDENDIKLTYDLDWPENDIITDLGSELKMHYRILNYDTYYTEEEHYSFISSNEDVATIDDDGVVTFTGSSYEDVTFSLVAHNSLSSEVDDYVLTSRTLSFADDLSTTLLPSANKQFISASVLENVVIDYTSNVQYRNGLEGNDSTEFTFEIYKADCSNISNPTKIGETIYSQVIDVASSESLPGYELDLQMFEKTIKNNYNYILEVTADDVEEATVVSAKSLIGIYEQPIEVEIYDLPNDNVYGIENIDIDFRLDYVNDLDLPECIVIVMDNLGNRTENTITITDDGDYSAKIPVEVADNEAYRLYTVSIKAKNGSDDTYSYDTTVFKVYNEEFYDFNIDEVEVADSYTLSGSNIDLSSLTSQGILDLDRRLEEEKYISIKPISSNGSYNDTFTWEIINDEINTKLELYDGRYVDSENSLSTTSRENFLINVFGNGSCDIRVTHDKTGISKTIKITKSFDDLENRLFIVDLGETTDGTSTVYVNNKEIPDTQDGLFAYYSSSEIDTLSVHRVVEGDSYYGDYSTYQDIINEQDFYSSSLDNKLFPMTYLNLEKIDTITNKKVEISYTDGNKYTGNIAISNVKLDVLDFNNNVTLQKDIEVNNVTQINGKSVITCINGVGSLEFDFGDDFSTPYKKYLRNNYQITYDIEILEGYYSGNYYDVTHTYYDTYDNITLFEEKSLIESITSKIDTSHDGVTTYTLVESDGYNSDIASYYINHNEKAVAYIPPSSRVMIKEGTSPTIDFELNSDYLEKLEMIYNSKINSVYIDVDGFNNAKFVLYSKSKNIHTNTGTLMCKTSTGNNNVSMKLKVETTDGGYYTTDMPFGYSYGHALISEDIVHDFDSAWESVEKVNDKILSPYTKGESHGITGDLPTEVVSLLREEVLDVLNNAKLGFKLQSVYVTPTPDYKSLEYISLYRLEPHLTSSVNATFTYLPKLNGIDYKYLPYLSYGTAHYNFYKITNLNRAYTTYSIIRANSKGTTIPLPLPPIKIPGGKVNVAFELGLDGGALIETNTSQINETYSSYISASRIYEKNTFKVSVKISKDFVKKRKIGKDKEYTVKYETSYQISTTNERISYADQPINISNYRYNSYALVYGGLAVGNFVISGEFGPFVKLFGVDDYMTMVKDGASYSGYKGTLFGSVGMKFKLKFLCITTGNKTLESKKYQLYGKSYGDYDIIAKMKNNISATSSRSMGVLGAYYEDATIDDNVDTTSIPEVTDDGSLMAYRGYDGFNDGIVVTSTEQDETYVISDSNYYEDNVSIDGTNDFSIVSWEQIESDLSDFDEDSSEDMLELLTNSQIKSAILKRDASGNIESTPVSVTDNDNCSISPISVSNGDKAGVVYQEYKWGNNADPLFFDGGRKIMYKGYNGTDFDAPITIADTLGKTIMDCDADMLNDGSMGVSYTLYDDYTDEYEHVLAIVLSDGTVNYTNFGDENSSPLYTRISKSNDGSDEMFLVATYYSGNTDEDINYLNFLSFNSRGALTGDIESVSEFDNYALSQNDFDFAKTNGDIDNLNFIVGINEVDEEATDNAKTVNENAEQIQKYTIYGYKFNADTDGYIYTSSRLALKTFENKEQIGGFATSTEDDNTVSIHPLVLNYSSGDEDEDGFPIYDIRIDSYNETYANGALVYQSDVEESQLRKNAELDFKMKIANIGLYDITHIKIDINNQTAVDEEITISSGTLQDFISRYTVTDIKNPEYKVTVTYSDGNTEILTGMLYSVAYNIGIDKIEDLSEYNGTRTYEVLLDNISAFDLDNSIHTGKLSVNYLENDEIKGLKKYDIDNLETLNNDKLKMTIELNRDEIFAILGDEKDIPEEGIKLIIETELYENETLVEQAYDYSITESVMLYPSEDSAEGRYLLDYVYSIQDGMSNVDIELTNTSIVNFDDVNLVFICKNDEKLVDTFVSEMLDEKSISIEGESNIKRNYTFNTDQISSIEVYATNSETSDIKLDSLNVADTVIVLQDYVYEYVIDVTGLDTIDIIAETNSDLDISICDGDEQIANTNIPINIGYNTYTIKVMDGLDVVEYIINVNNKQITDNDGGNYNDGSSNNKKNKNKANKEEYSVEITKTFDDVTVHWAKVAIESLASLDIVVGKGNNIFDPNGTITRAEFVTLMVRYFDLLPSDNNTDYVDVESGFWYEDYIISASDNQILPDIYGENFEPEKQIMREEMMYILYKSLEVTDKLDMLEDNGDKLSDFADSDTISSYAVEGSEYLISTDIINGSGNGYFKPTSTSTRAEVAQMIWNMVKLIQ